jgi:hypothetical protein
LIGELLEARVLHYQRCSLFHLEAVQVFKIHQIQRSYCFGRQLQLAKFFL